MNEKPWGMERGSYRILDSRRGKLAEREGK